jgi:hypothetical protein
MTASWKKKPYYAGPWGDQRPEWLRNGGRVPAIGPTGRSPYSRTHMDAREAAWQRMCDRVSTAYLKNRRPFTPGG